MYALISMIFSKHIQMDIGDKFKSARVSGVAFVCFDLNYTATIWPIWLIFLWKHMHIFSSYCYIHYEIMPLFDRNIKSLKLW